MKKLIIILSLFNIQLLGQCPENIWIVDSEDLLEFELNYPNCIEVNNITIIALGDSNITNLEPLANIKIINGSLEIISVSQIGGQIEIANLQGLNNIDSIYGNLHILGNKFLTNLNGLESLEYIGGSLIIGEATDEYNSIPFPIPQYQSNLTNVNGLEGLKSVGSLSIKNNMSLTNLNGLSNLESINGDLIIYGNALLSFCEPICEIINLNNVAGSINISAESCTDITCFDRCNSFFDLPLSNSHNINTISAIISNCSGQYNGSLRVRTTNGLFSEPVTIENLSPLLGLKILNGDLVIGGFNELEPTPLKSIHGLDSLKIITGNLDLRFLDSTKITSLKPLEQLMSVGGNLEIWCIENLSLNLSNLTNTTADFRVHSIFPHDIIFSENLEKIGGEIEICVTKYANLDFLENVDPLETDNVIIRLNSDLEMCDNTFLCNYLDMGKPNYIELNSSSCNSSDQILTQCLLNIDNDGDGYNVAEDCDDDNPNINPGQIEIPYNEIDEDCNESTLDDDLDVDGFKIDLDCNDEDSSINPDATEIPNNGIDEDCDGSDLTSSTNEIATIGLNIYPNPVKDELNINIKSIENYKITLITIDGIRIQSFSGAPILNLSGIEYGCYFLEFRNQNTGYVISKIIIVE